MLNSTCLKISYNNFLFVQRNLPIQLPLQESPARNGKIPVILHHCSRGPQLRPPSCNIGLLGHQANAKHSKTTLVLDLHATTLHSTPPTTQDHVQENTNLAANDDVGETMPTLKPDNTSRFILSTPIGFNSMQAEARLQNSALKQNESLSIILASPSVNSMNTKLE
jgi:hypothetical protein